MSEVFWYLSSGLPSDPSRTGIKVIFPKKFLKGTLRVWLYYCNGTGIFCETCQLFSDLRLYNSHSYVPRKIWLNCINIFHMSLCKLWRYPGWVLVFILMFLTNFFFFFKSCPSQAVWKKSVFRVFLARIFPHLDRYGSEKLRIRTLFTQYPFQILTTSRR